MDRSDEDAEFDSSWDVLSFLQSDQVESFNDKPADHTESSGPSSSLPPFTLNNLSKAHFAGDALNDVATSSVEPGLEHTNDGAEAKRSPEPVIQSKRSAVPRANDNIKSAKPKRVRGPNWTEDEKNALLVLKLEALTSGPSIKGANWSKDVSKDLMKNYSHDRASKSCQQQWDTLLKSFKAIREHESKVLLSGNSSCVSFWKMDKQKRRESIEELPQVFYKAWYVLMENIIEAETAAKKTPEPIKGATNIRRTATSIQIEGENPQSSSIQAPSTITSDLNPRLEPASDANRSKPSFSQTNQVKLTIPPMPQFSHLVCTDHQDSQQNGDEALRMSLPKCAALRSPQRPEDDEVSDMTEDDLISRIAPFVNKQIKDSLEPIKSILLNREQDEHKRHQEAILTIEKEKLALMQAEEHLLYTHHGAASIMSDIAGTSADAQAEAQGVWNSASPTLAQGEHIADHGRHNEIQIMQGHPCIS